MLTELKLTNFRIFDDEVMVRFKPITVLIGRNSSGKSTIIKFLLMLQQSLGSGKSQFLTSEGERVNLGVFSELKNALTVKSNLFFELAADGPQTMLPNNAVSVFLESPENIGHGRYMYKAGATVPYGSNFNLSPLPPFGARSESLLPSYYRTHGPGQTGFYLVDNVLGKTVLEVDNEVLSNSKLLEVPTSDSMESLQDYDNNELSSENNANWFNDMFASWEGFCG